MSGPDAAALLADRDAAGVEGIAQDPDTGMRIGVTAHEGVERSVAGKAIRFCTAEDLILYKIISDRERDLRDVEGIMRRRGPELDRAYLDPRVQELADILEQPDIMSRYQDWLQT